MQPIDGEMTETSKRTPQIIQVAQEQIGVPGWLTSSVPVFRTSEPET